MSRLKRTGEEERIRNREELKGANKLTSIHASIKMSLFHLFFLIKEIGSVNNYFMIVRLA